MFKVAGVSKLDGQVKVRFANDLTRVKVLAKGGHTDITLVELPSEMDKPDVVKWLMQSELMQTAEFAEAIEEANEKYNGQKATKDATLKTGSAKPAKSAKKAVDAPAADLSDEDRLAALRARAESAAS